MLALGAAGCATRAPRDVADREIYVEASESAPICRECGRPFERGVEHVEPDRQVARTRFRFPFEHADVDRCFSVGRALSPAADARMAHLALLAGSAAEDAQGNEGETARPRELKREVPSLFWFPERADLRDQSACYVGHSAFLDGERGLRARPIHHLRLRVVNREPRRVEVPLTVFFLSPDPSDPRAEPIPLVAATGDRGATVEKLEVLPGGEGAAHLFFRETTGLSPVLRMRWVIRLVADDGTVEERLLAATVVRRYVAREAPLSALEDRVSRGEELSELNASGPWVDPGLQAVGGR